MKVIIGCECSGVVRRAFRALGHDAWSCDMKPSDDGSEHHHVGDAIEFAKSRDWDLGVFHPPCTRLCNSGVLRLYSGGKKANGIDAAKWEEMRRGALFFKQCLSLQIPMLCIENPVPHGHADLPEYTQTIQPYQFGDPESKRTCLWLKNLPALKPTNILKKPECGHWENQTPSGQNKLGPSEHRAAQRAKTYEGIAKAMAEQWSEFALSSRTTAKTALIAENLFAWSATNTTQTVIASGQETQKNKVLKLSKSWVNCGQYGINHELPPLP